MELSPRSIGIVLDGHLGDVVLYSSTLKPIRDRFSDSEIILIASPAAKELFGECVYVDRVVEARELYRNRDMQMPNLAVDALIFPHHFASAPWFNLLTVVERREVIACKGGPFIDSTGEFQRLNPIWQDKVTTPIEAVQDGQFLHVFNHIVSFLKQLGCPIAETSDLRVTIDIRDEDRLSAISLVERFKNQSYGMIFPGGNFKREIKMWPLDRYAEVIRLLGDAGPKCWLICGGATEFQDCLRVVQSVQDRCPQSKTMIDSGGPLRRVAAMLEGAEVAIGSDNGGMHLAVAVGRPTVSIVSGAPRTPYFPWGDPEKHRALMRPMACRGCRFQCVLSSPACVEEITPKAVADACASVMGVIGRERNHGY